FSTSRLVGSETNTHIESCSGANTLCHQPRWPVPFRHSPADFSPSVSHETINSPAQLADLCARLARADRIGIDTEFVSEDTYRPELCLIQVATKDILTVIDPYRAGKLDVFWETLADGEHTTIVHAAREELNFSLNACGRPPA